MQIVLEELDKNELITLVKPRDEENAYLKAQVEMLHRMQFGQKRERFEEDPGSRASGQHPDR